MTILQKLTRQVDSFYGRLILVITAGLGILMFTNYFTVHTVQRLYVYEAEYSRAQHIAGYVILLEDASAEDRSAAVEKLNTSHFNGTTRETLAIFDTKPDWGKTPETIERQVEVLKTVLAQEGTAVPETFARLVDKGNPLFEVHLPSVEFAVQLSDGKWLTISTLLQVDDRVVVWSERGLILLEGLIILLLSAWLVRRLTQPLDRLSRSVVQFGEFPEHSQSFPEEGVKEIRGAAKSFNRMREQIQGNLLERNRIISAMAHDLRTPLTRLQLRLDRVEDETLRAKLTESVADMKSIIEQGLGFARSLDTTEGATRMDLLSVIASLVDDYADVGHDVSLAANLLNNPRAMVIEARALCLKRCLENLITNACKYGGSAEVDVRELDRAYVVTVADNGPGIPEDLLEKVFEPYFRVESSRNRTTGGTGLGLAIARNMAHLNGGTLTLKNRVQGGLVATLTLPKLKAELPAHAGRGQRSRH